MRRALLPLIAALLVAGCAERSNSDILDSARQYAARGENDAAAIELRTLLQRKPDAGEARFLLGKVSYESGDLAGAEEQLRQALQLGYPEEEAIPLLATVLASMNRSTALLQDYAKTEFADDPAATARLKLQLAIARMFERRFDDAAADVELALKLAPDLVDAQVLRARLHAIKGDTAEASRQVEAILKRQPESALALALKADLLMTSVPQPTDQAIEAHRQALRQRANLVQSHAAILAMLIARGDIEPAAKQWEALSKALPKHPQTRYFESLIALRKGQVEKARNIAHAMLIGSPTDLRVLMVAGEAELRLDSLEQAEALLSKALKHAAAAVPPRHLLAELYLRTGRADEALAVLEPLLGAQSGDAYAHALAGRAKVAIGDVAGAKADLDRALKLQPGDRRIQLVAAVAQVRMGNLAAGFAELERIAKAGDDTAADLTLIAERLERREWDLARKAVAALEAKTPRQALPVHLEGRILMAQGQTAEARKRFEEALTRDPGYFPAVANLAAIDVSEGRATAAIERFEAVRQREPKNAQVRLAMARVVAQVGSNPAAAEALIGEAITANPGDANAHLALIDHHLAVRNADRALAVAQAVVAKLPESLPLLDGLGRAAVAVNDLDQAIGVYSKMSRQWPRSSLPYIRLAHVYLAKKNLDAASESAEQAMKVAPRSLEAQRLAVVAALRQNQTKRALAVARRLQEQRPDEATGFILEGDVELAVRNYGGAAAAYRKALGEGSSTEAAKRLYVALLGSRDKGEAERWAKSWREKRPDDVEFVVHLADVAVTRGDLAQAELHYREVLKRLPENALAMNNVAYVVLKQKKAGAVPLAERAAQLAPGDANVLDTLAAAYALDGKLQKAVETQYRAVQAAPGAHLLRLNLARLLLEAKDRERAIVELDRLAQLGKSFSGYAEVARMRKKAGP